MTERFANVPVARLDSQRLRLDGAVAWFDCDIHQLIEAGDHHIVLGAVRGFGSTDAGGLGYYRSKMAQFAALPA
jgi:3-hydroxy-9,10-secoandrosta-1,3,5(10)-triene-9,17-dione monooxygenase reductase component